MTPGLGLSYSSSSGLGEAGLGWDLVGASWIERDTRNGVPHYDATDRFVFRAGGGAATLVKVSESSAFGGVEYRLFDDSEDVQFLYLRESNSWKVRYRSGRVSEYRARAVQNGVEGADGTFGWALETERDSNGNIIAYEYDASLRSEGAFGEHFSGSVQGRNMPVRPVLSRVLWGGNDGSAGAPRTGALFVARFVRHFTDTSAADADGLDEALPHECLPYLAVSDFRSGGLYFSSGAAKPIRGVIIEATAQGDGHDSASRIVRKIALTYNWNEGGCHNADQLHLQLRHAQAFVLSHDALTWTAEPKTSFSYNGFERKFRKVAEVALPSSLRDDPAAGESLRHGLSRNIRTAQNTEADSSVGPMRLFAGGGTVGLFDADFDGTLDLVDTQPRITGDFTNPRVSGHIGQFFAPSREGGFADSATPLSYDALLSRDWSFNTLKVGRETFGGVALPLGLDVSDEWTAVPRGEDDDVRYYQSGNTIRSELSLLIDVDADGYEDLVRWQGDEAPLRTEIGPHEEGGADETRGRGGPVHVTVSPRTTGGPFERTSEYGYGWVWYRNETGRGEGVRFSDGQPIDSRLWTQERGSRTSDWSFPSPYEWTDFYPRFGWSRWMLNGTRTLSRRVSDAHVTGLGYLYGEDSVDATVTDSVLGAPLDLNGDGLLDRVVNARTRDGRRGALVMYPGTAPGVFGAPRMLWEPQTTEESSMPRTVSRRVSMARFSPENVTRDIRSVTTDIAVDVNGDGLVDAHSVKPVFDSWRESGTAVQLRATYARRAAPVLNYGGGLMDWYVGVVLGAPPMQDAGPLYLGALDIAPAGADRREDAHRVHSARVEAMDFNGDGFTDFVAAQDGFIQYGRGGYYTEPLRFVPEGLGTATEPRLFRTVTQGPAAVLSGKQVIADVTHDGRPDLLVMIGNTNRFEVWSDQDPSLAPGKLHAVTTEGSEVRFSYQTIHAARAPSEVGPPVHGCVVREVTRSIEGGAAPLVTRYAYEGAVLARSLETKSDGSPLVYRAGMQGYRNVSVCHSDGTLSTYAYTYEGQDQGLLVSTRLYGRTADFSPSRPGKCEAGDLSTNTAYQARLRAESSTEYNTWTYPHEGHEFTVTRRLKTQRQRSFIPGQEGSQGSETSFAYTFVSGRRVPSLITTRTMPEEPGRTTVTTLIHAANGVADSDNYAVLEIERQVRDARGVLLARSQKYFDGQDGLGAFSKGNVTKVRTYLLDGDERAYSDTAFSLDGFGHVRRVQSQEGLVWTTCWDALALYPARTQNAQGLVTGQKVDIAKGLVTETYGPLNIPTSPLVCGNAEPQGNFDARRAPAPLVRPAPQKLFSDTPRVAVTEGALYPQRTAPAVDPSELDRYTRTAFGGTTSYELVENPLPIAPPRGITGLSTERPEMLPSAGLSEESPLPAAVPTNTTRYHYDGLSRLVRVETTNTKNREGLFVFADVAATKYERTGALELVTTTRAFEASASGSIGRRNPTSRVLVDAWGRPLQRATAQAFAGDSVERWSMHAYAYAETGELVSAEGPGMDPAASPTQTEITAFDDLVRPVEVQSPRGGISGSTERFERSADGFVRRVVSGTDAEGFLSEVVYDAAGLPIESRVTVRSPVTDTGESTAEVLRTSARYDALGRITHFIDENGTVARSQYDLGGRVAQRDRFATWPDIDANRPLSRHVYAYDRDNKLITDTETGNMSGRVEIGMMEPRTTTYRYDAKGRIERVIPPRDSTAPNYDDTVYAYEDRYTESCFGQTRSITSATETRAFACDAIGRANRVTVDVHVDIAGRELSDRYAYALEHNLAGAPKRITFIPRIGDESTHEHTRFEYGPTGRLLRTIDEARGSSRTIEEYAYTDAGVLRTITNIAGVTETLTRNIEGGLEEHVIGRRDSTWTESTEFMLNGLPRRVRTSDNRGIAPAFDRTFSYDEKLRIRDVTRTLSSSEGTRNLNLHIDYQANRIAGRTEQLPGESHPSRFEYRYRGQEPTQLTELLRNGHTAETFAYDQKGTENQNGDVTSRTDAQGRVYQKGNTHYAHDAAGNVSHIYDETTDHIYARAGLVDLTYTQNEAGDFIRSKAERLVGSARIEVGTGQVQFVHRDFQNSPALVYQNSEIPQFQRNAYTEFGKPVVTQAALPFDGFQGGWKDPGSDSTIFGIATYSPNTFLRNAPDPMWGNPQYGYNHNNPVRYSDLSGWDPIDEIEGRVDPEAIVIRIEGTSHVGISQPETPEPVYQPEDAPGAPAATTPPQTTAAPADRGTQAPLQRPGAGEIGTLAATAWPWVTDFTPRGIERTPFLPDDLARVYRAGGDRGPRSDDQCTRLQNAMRSLSNLAEYARERAAGTRDTISNYNAHNDRVQVRAARDAMSHGEIDITAIPETGSRFGGPPSIPGAFGDQWPRARPFLDRSWPVTDALERRAQGFETIARNADQWRLQLQADYDRAGCGGGASARAPAPAPAGAPGTTQRMVPIAAPSPTTLVPIPAMEADPWWVQVLPAPAPGFSPMDPDYGLQPGGGMSPAVGALLIQLLFPESIPVRGGVGAAVRAVISR